MKYVWCILFAVWPLLAVAACVVAPGFGLWFPEGADGSTESINPLGREIDGLFHIILSICTAVFVLTQAALVWALLKGSGRGRAKYVHGNFKLEVIWTLIPAVLLVFIAFYQMDVWASFRVKDSFPAGLTPVAEVTGRMYEWRIRYPAPGKPLRDVPQPDDLYTVNRLLVPSGEPVSIQLRSEDVQHSFSLPQFRIKQDALPGQVIPVWFLADGPGNYTLLCQELCGWGHYKMGGEVEALPPDGHAARMEALAAAQSSDGVGTDGDAAAWTVNDARVAAATGGN